MVVVDDNIQVRVQFDNGSENDVVVGKGIYMHHFFKDVGIEPVYMGYQFVWKL
jgi:hypothetical protein